jgi:hypothetical protein
MSLLVWKTDFPIQRYPSLFVKRPANEYSERGWLECLTIHLLVGLLHDDPSGFEIPLPREAGLTISTDEEFRSYPTFLTFGITVLTNCSLIIL